MGRAGAALGSAVTVVVVGVEGAVASGTDGSDEAELLSDDRGDAWPERDEGESDRGDTGANVVTGAEPVTPPVTCVCAIAA